MSIDDENLRYFPISLETQNYIACLRGCAILTIVFGHVGGYWACQPYSSYLHASGSTFFYFLSGAVLYHSYCRSKSLYIYLVKRFASLLVPYYFICIIALFVYLINNHSFPKMNINNLLDWVLIQPRNQIMPFPLGQLWFLHTYILLFLISPVIFILFRKSNLILYFFYAIFIVLTVFQYYFGVLFINNKLLYEAYNLLFYSVFFVYGMVLYSGNVKFNKLAKVLLIIIPTVLFLLMNNKSNIVSSFDNRDVLAILITFILSGVTFVFKDQMLKIIIKIKYLFYALKFYHVNTFAVYLLHTLSIYFAENIFGLVDPPIKSINYGLTKFAVVLVLCSLMAIPYTKLTKGISQWLVCKMTRS